MNKKFAIIEIGSNNTKTHIYNNNEIIYENNTTIEFKKNYLRNKIINQNDIEKLFEVIRKTLEYTNNVHIYGCSIFRNLTNDELQEINLKLYTEFALRIEVVTQEDEAKYTALGCYNNIEYDGNICVFIGGGGSIELIFVNNKKIIKEKYYDFGVVDITNKFNDLKEDIPNCTFDEVYNYIDNLIGNINEKADVLILAGGDHLYWYNNAIYKLEQNTTADTNYEEWVPITDGYVFLDEMLEAFRLSDYEVYSLADINRTDGIRYTYQMQYRDLEE